MAPRSVIPPGWSPWPPAEFVQRLNEQRPPGQTLRVTDPLAMSLWHLASLSSWQPSHVVLISGC